KFGPIPWVYVEIVRHLARSERVRILVEDTSAESVVRSLLKKADVSRRRVEFFHFPTNRVWTRDYGPLFAKDEQGQLTVLDFRFNAWAKYDDWHLDNAVPAQAAYALKLPRHQPEYNGQRVVLEGGSIDVNGAGLLLTTEECLLSPVQARNPGLTRADLEHVLGEYFGARKVLWLNRGIAGDDTHGHIDDLARFIRPRKVVTVVEEDPSDVNYEPLRENLERLRGMTDVDGQPLEIVTLPLPSPLTFAGERLPASYANFYIANKCVLVPTFNDPRDRQAM